MSGERRESKRWRRTIFRIGASGALLVVLVYLLPIDQLWSSLRLLPSSTWLFCLAGFLFGHLVLALKWHLMVNIAGARIALRTSLHCYFGGLFGNLVMPSLIGGDAVSVAFGLRHTHNKPGLVLGCLAGRAVDSVSLGFLVAVGSLLAPLHPSIDGTRILIFILAGTVLGTVLTLVGVRWLRGQSLSYRWRRRLARTRAAFRSTLRQPFRLVLALMMALVIQVFFTLLNAWIGWSTKIDLPFSVWVLAWPLAKLAAFLPIGYAGIGVREVALGVILKPFGVEYVDAVAVGLLWETVLVAGGLCSGAVSYFFRSSSAVGAVAGLPDAGSGVPTLVR